MDAHYGRYLRTEEDGDDIVYTYAFLDFEVLVTFLDGKSQSELYYHPDNRPLSPKDRELILSLNALGNNWRTFEGVLVLVKPAGGHPIAVGAYESDAHPPVLGVCIRPQKQEVAMVTSNQAMQPTTGRRTLKFSVARTSSPAATLALASGG